MATLYARMLAQAKKSHPDWDDDDLADLATDWCHEEAQFRAENPIEDSPCLEDGRDNCDDHGTGEGRWHGRIG